MHRMPPLRRSAAIATLGLALLAAPASALKPGYRTVVNKGVKATVSWSKGNGILGDKPVVTITRQSVREVNHRHLAAKCDLCGSIAVPRRSLHVRDLDGDGDPEVLVDLFSGGAHCCSTTIIFTFVRDHYKAIVASWGNDSYVVTDYDHNGVKELLTGDDRFSEEFTAYAFGARPILLFSLLDHRIKDVTRAFPTEIQGQMNMFDRALANRHKGDDLRGVVAARAADMALLGQAGGIEAFVDDAQQRGLLDGDSTWPAGAKYKPALLKFLRKLGYI